ncbi:MAG TPA: MarR family winged helix-turn-helix transcriptional regulator [Chloroflexota bacterium]|nr:MarR family winged helix-turn-helix transcriptional regulator [Chloroflexota bacterium]
MRETDDSGRQARPPRRHCDGPTTASRGPISHAICALARAHRAAAGSLLRQAGLYPGQELLLMQLWDQDHQPQSALVKVLGVEPPTVTKMLQRLEQQGFVARQQSDEDRRAVIVSLTARGAALREQVAQLWVDLERRTTIGMTERQRRDTVRVLTRLEQNLTLGEPCAAPVDVGACPADAAPPNPGSCDGMPYSAGASS